MLWNMISPYGTSRGVHRGRLNHLPKWKKKYGDWAVHLPVCNFWARSFSAGSLFKISTNLWKCCAGAEPCLSLDSTACIRRSTLTSSDQARLLTMAEAFSFKIISSSWSFIENHIGLACLATLHMMADLLFWRIWNSWLIPVAISVKSAPSISTYHHTVHAEPVKQLQFLHEERGKDSSKLWR